MAKNRSIYIMPQDIWDGFVMLIVGLLFGIFLFKIALLPDGTNIFEITDNVVYTAPL
jgi:hypothetical protein